MWDYSSHGVWEGVRTRSPNKQPFSYRTDLCLFRCEQSYKSTVVIASGVDPFLLTSQSNIQPKTNFSADEPQIISEVAVEQNKLTKNSFRESK